MDDLSTKQKRFVEEYLIDLNATAAYKRAGYKGQGNAAEASASRMLSSVKISHYVKLALEKRSNELGIDQQYVLKTIKETVDRCRQAAPVLDHNGNPVYVEGPDGEMVPAFTFDAKNVLKGAELLGRHVGIKGFVKEEAAPPPATNNVLVLSEENMLEVARRIAFVMANGSRAVKGKTIKG